MCIAAYSLLGNAQTQIKFESEYFADSIIAGDPKLTFERLIPYAPNQEIEERHRKAGLHLWYLVEAPVEKFEGKKGIKHVRATKLIEMPDVPIIPVESPVITSKSTRSVSMNDPLYEKQWHYHEQCPGSINLPKAWEKEEGNPNVLVAVMDQWIDHTHPDLAANMWVNRAEQDGLPNVDDDGNGYVDDIHGLNLTSNSEFGNHGTHVAGTIAAVNNNGIGVCGIAGGNGNDTGVKLMSVAIIPIDNNKVEDYMLARGYVYAADMGAIISSNSWKRTNDEQVEIILEGIEYFMKNSGQYEGSLMNGGLVVFGAANDGGEKTPFPISGLSEKRDNLIVVASVASNGIRSTFSNYGDWIDISAPGGEEDGKGVYSTYTDNRYGFQNGTSMACPHVSGVAALVVSKFGGASLTPSQVKEIIINSSAEVDKYQIGYPYAGKLGAGILNADAALNSNLQTAPDSPKSFRVTRDSQRRTYFEWAVPLDANSSPVAYCAVYADDTEKPLFTAKTSNSEEFCVVAQDVEASSFTIQAIDAFGNSSHHSTKTYLEEISAPIIKNTYNNSNVIVHRPGNYYEYALPVCEVNLFCANVESYSVEEPNNIVSSYYNDSLDVLCLRFNVTQTTPLGDYPLTVKYGIPGNEDKTLELRYSVLPALQEITGPMAIPDKANIYTSDFEGTIEMNLRDYIYDPLGLDFIILDDVKPEDPGDFEYFEGEVVNERLKIRYRFNDLIWPGSNIPFVVKTINSYLEEGSATFLLHYIEETNIGEITTDGIHRQDIYNMQGMKQNNDLQNLKPGIYIIKGSKRKVIL